MSPRNAATLEALQGRRPQEPTSAIPREVMDFQLTSPLQLDSKCVREVFLREAPSGCSPGRGCTNEMLRVCLDGHELLQLLFSASEDFARGSVPPTVGRVLMVATMTALQKPDGGEEGVRGIAKCHGFPEGSSSPRLWNQSVPHSNSLCLQEREQIALRGPHPSPHRCQPRFDSDFNRRRGSS